MQNTRTISRASLILGALSQHLFGARFAQARAGNAQRAVRTAQPSGSKPAGNRGMHAPHVTGGFRPMAHGKLGKKYPASASKRAQRNRQRGYAKFLRAVTKRLVPIPKAA